MGRVQLNSDWLENVLACTDRFFLNRLGPDIRDDAKDFCPVETGDLKDSIECHLDGHTLIVRATGSDSRFYGAYLELGHRVYHPSTGEVGPETVAPSPFLRPALWQVRNY